MPAEWVRVRAPATIANVGPGFDVFCLAVRGPWDEVSVRRAREDALEVEGVGAESLPTTFTENTAGIVIGALRRATGILQPVQVRVRKGIPPGRGLGSSAASCAAAALAFAKTFPKARSLGLAGLIHAAVEGEAAVSGRHYDNVCGALLGGFVSIASTQPLILAREPVSPRIHLAIAIPERILRTSDMRQVLPVIVPFREAVGNVGRAATLAMALVRGDARLAGRCLEDRIVEPVRAPFIPGCAEARSAALESGATGFSISGSGSSVFAIAGDRTRARRAAQAMCEAFAARGIRANPLATTVDSRVPLAIVLPKLGRRFSVVAD